MQFPFHWIGMDKPSRHASLLLRKSFLLEKEVCSARARVIGLGLYQFSVNGQAVGDYVLTPLETEYKKRLLFDTYDITELIRRGENALGLECGNGRYATPIKYQTWRATYYGPPCGAVSVELTCTDGTQYTWTTDTSWKCAQGAVTDNCFYDGESYDARLLPRGWNEPDFDDVGWEPAVSVKPACDNWEENTYFHLKPIRTLKPQGVHNMLIGMDVYTFGENIAGWVRIRVQGKPGTKITLRYAEDMDGGIQVQSNRLARNTDTYILGSSDIEEYQPRFTLHGFSAVEITVEDREAEVLEVEAMEVRADVEQTGVFHCGHLEIQRLHEAIVRTQSAALMSFPMDCPQRDERLGWLGDAHVTDLTCLYNFDMRQFYKKWFGDIAGNCDPDTGMIPFIAPFFEKCHSIDWSAGFPIITWDYFEFYRDKSVISEYYPYFCRYTDFLLENGFIQPRTKYGDWLSVAPGWKRGDPECCPSLYLYQLLRLLVKFAGVLGLEADVCRYTALAEQSKAAILERFFDPQEGRFDDNSQFSLAFALYLELIPAAYVDKLVADIADRDHHLTTGILGTKYVMAVLRRHHREDVAMKLILQPDYPGWLHLIRNRSTLSENWDGSGSHNHCMFGSVDAVLYEMLGGILVGEEITVSPYFAPEVPEVETAVCYGDGKVAVSWKRQAGGITLEIQVTGTRRVRLCLGDTEELLTPGNHRRELP